MTIYTIEYDYDHDQFYTSNFSLELIYYKSKSQDITKEPQLHDPISPNVLFSASQASKISTYYGAIGHSCGGTQSPESSNINDFTFKEPARYYRIEDCPASKLASFADQPVDSALLSGQARVQKQLRMSTHKLTSNLD
jgi:hypothetical protein